MKRFPPAWTLGLIGLIGLLAAAPAAHAAGLGLRWGSCEGTANRNFACDRNTGTEVLVGSFVPPGGITEMTGIEVYMHITTADGQIPAWWQMVERGGCRSTSLSMQAEVSDQVECDDPWEGQGMGGIARYKADGSSGIDVIMGIAVATNNKHALSSGRTYAAFKLLINHFHTSGPGACGGCETPACITFDRLVIAQYSPQDPVTNESRPRNSEITLGLPGSGNTPGNLATWQGGNANCGAGLSKTSSWSQVKDRFRSH